MEFSAGRVHAFLHSKLVEMLSIGRIDPPAAVVGRVGVISYHRIFQREGECGSHALSLFAALLASAANLPQSPIQIAQPVRIRRRLVADLESAAVVLNRECD